MDNHITDIVFLRLVLTFIINRRCVPYYIVAVAILPFSTTVILFNLFIINFWFIHRVIATKVNNYFWFSVKGRIGKEPTSISKVHDSEIGLSVIFEETCTSTNDLLKLGHAVDVVL